MAEPDGLITIDGLNIKDLSLSDLRSKIAIIPVIFLHSVPKQAKLNSVCCLK
jgi:ABC-type multidrug transport system fused ATPase/permease subunit